MEAINKLRDMLRWANDIEETINCRFKSISDIEKVYDYCKQCEISMNYFYFESDSDYKFYSNSINKMVKYKLI